jgi:hypothetical protein
MNRVNSAAEVRAASRIAPAVEIATAAEVAAVFAGILLYIWRWQHVYPHAWIGLWALVLASQVVHRDSFRTLGLTATDFLASAHWAWPVAIGLYLPLLAYGFVQHRLLLPHLTWQAPLLLLGYGSWCAVQQYLAQSYFHNRLMLVMRNRHARSLLVGIMFSATHIPNVILMAATLVAGVVFAEVFARYRNIWPLALAQAVGGLLLAAVSPEALIHHMRVGPGYYFFGIR